MPLDALHSASRIDTTRLTLSAPLGVWVSATIWSREQRLGRLGQRRAARPRPAARSSQGRRRARTGSIPAISAGGIARNAAYAMPPARIPTLSADDSLNARRVTCHQPFGGIWVGSSAWSPGRSAESEAWPACPVEPGEAAVTPGSAVATCPLVSGPPGRGGRGRNGSTRACRAVDWSLRLRSAARPTTAHASALAPGTPEAGRPGGSSGWAEDEDDGEDVGGRDTGVLRRSRRNGTRRLASAGSPCGPVSTPPRYGDARVTSGVAAAPSHADGGRVPSSTRPLLRRVAVVAGEFDRTQPGHFRGMPTAPRAAGVRAGTTS